jgi:hypothetical protein
MATFLLTSGSVRGDGVENEISLPAGTRQVQFRIELGANEYETYEASLNRIEGRRLFVQKSVNGHASTNGVTLFVVVPARRLPAGVSILTLRGFGKTGGAQVLSKYVMRVGAK